MYYAKGNYKLTKLYKNQSSTSTAINNEALRVNIEIPECEGWFLKVPNVLPEICFLFMTYLALTTTK